MERKEREREREREIQRERDRERGGGRRERENPNPRLAGLVQFAVNEGCRMRSEHKPYTFAPLDAAR